MQYAGCSTQERTTINPVSIRHFSFVIFHFSLLDTLASVVIDRWSGSVRTRMEPMEYSGFKFEVALPS
jgi:hypothetical protein